ncbi:MAG: polyketide cyclase [Desulfobulbaceae bacterium]|nr:polyketide cyclase [Desulfobulbaceae bacterium]
MKAFVTQRKIGKNSQEIFKAFKDQDALSKWWGPAGFIITTDAIEFKTKGKWKFVMHGPDGANYPNEMIFQEITEPNKIVMRHSVEPYFTATFTVEDIAGGAVIEFCQDFDNEEVAKNIAHIVKPANEQILDKLQALVAGS